MSSKFYIKKNDTSEELKVVMRKRQEPVDGVVPEDSLYLSPKPIQNVKFSMAKIPQTQADGSVLYPDGTIHQTDGTILNPLGNPDIFISAIRVRPGEVLNTDYSVTQTNGQIRYPTGLLYDPSELKTYLPDNSLILPNGMLRLPPNPAYPDGYVHNPGNIDRTNYYKVGNPTNNLPNPNGDISIPNGSYLDQTNALTLPATQLHLPEGTSLLSTTTVKYPAGSTKEASTTISRDNAIILPNRISFYPNTYEATYNSATFEYTFILGTFLTYDPENTPNRKATITMPNAQTFEVPWETVTTQENVYIFPPGTLHIFAERKFIFPGLIQTLPLSATINVFGSNVSVTFVDGTVIDDQTFIATLPEQNVLNTSGDALQYDGTTIKLNTNHQVLYNGYEFYPRGTQKNSFGTIIHPTNSPVPASSYINYYPTRSHPTGLIIRPTDAAIVNADGTFTKLDNSIVDINGVTIQPASTTITLYEATTNPPFIPVNTQTVIVTINQATASHQIIQYPVSTNSQEDATLFTYPWKPQDTAHIGLYSGEFTITHTDNTKRTFPILKDDALFIEILDHFSTWE